MSGHNPPHGRLGQPNSTWNPLQVPYIPRQPQLAHMSSERSMARSPVTWHTPPTHQDQLYNFMTANHKNNLEINPMLPTFGRSSGMPLGSVDLSLSSAARSTPSPKGSNLQPGPPGPSQHHLSPNIPPALGGGPMPDQNDHFHPKMVPGHNQQQQQHHNSQLHQQQHQPHHHMNTNHNRSPSAAQIGGVIQSTAALKDRSGQHSAASAGGGSGGSAGSGSGSGNAASCSFLGNSGSNNMGLGSGSAGGNGYYNMMSSSSSGSGSGNSSACVDGSNSINRPLSGHIGGAPASLPTMVPSEFAAMIPGGLHIKDAKQINNEAGKNGRDIIPTNNESSDLVKDILLHAMQSNPISISPKRNCPLRTPVPPNHSPTRSRSPPASVLLQSMAQSSTASVNKSFQSNPTNVPSTLETSDTSGTKTISSPNAVSPVLSTSVVPAAASTDRASPNQSITSNEDSADSNSSKSRRRRKPDRTNKMGAEELDRMHDFLGGGDNSADKCDRIEGIDPMRPNIAVRNDIATLALEGISSLSQGLASDSSHSPHITDLSDSTRINLQNLSEGNSANGGESKSPAVGSVISSVLSAAAAAVMGSARKDSESNSDDCETIDKIAAMISSTENDGANTQRLPVEAVASAGKNSESGRNCNGPAKETPSAKGSLSSGSDKADLNKNENETDKSFEEVENKLEEMFAGIDESEPPCTKPSPSTGKKSPSVKQPTESTDILIALSGKSEESAPPSSGQSLEASEDSPVASTSGTQKKVLTPAAKRANAGKSAGGGSPNKRKKVLKKKPVQSKGASFAAAEERAANFGTKGGKKPLSKGNGRKGNGSGSAGSKNSKAKPNEGGAAVDPNGKYKGPYVQVKSDGSHLVINTPINEDDSDKPQNKTKKFVNCMNSTERSKIRGLHVSTLSTKYDADTTDTSWMCVFCKTGPHKQRLGDLFGPYIISTKSSEFEQSQTDEDFFNVKRTKESLQSKLIKKEETAGSSNAPKAKKRKIGVEPASTSPIIPSTSTAQQQEPDEPLPPVDIFYGMIKAGDDSYEVWMHEDCLVWAPGVHIIGTRVVGLEAAIWNCCRHRCRICSYQGATVSCLQRGCNEEAHVVCARRNDWELSDEFKPHCEKHTKADS
ncbi:uncharacterized protein CG5098 [Ochlerotatus camptorhynchus]|uniref:uncharacterized protein CG5098 n=1 Tax=Ochlerotatus camptorhynchus TaxID=644619 RepID=UPI0031E096AB